MTTGTRAERLDLALDELLAGRDPQGDGGIAPLLAAAALVRDALPPIPAGSRFETRMLGRLEERSGVSGAVEALGRAAQRELRKPARILAAGAVSTAAVGVTVTAVAVWRARRQ
jgi:hypothetical protein